MIQKSAAIILRRVKAYTEQFGLQSYLVKGARTKRSRFKANYFEVFAVLELVASRKENHSLHTLRELSLLQPHHNIALDLAKSSQALFLAEVLTKCLQEGKPDPTLYHFLTTAIHLLDLEAKANPHYHLVFLIRLAHHLGFCPATSPENTSYFDLNYGEFTGLRPEHNYFLDPPLARQFGQLLHHGFQTLEHLHIPKPQRKELLEKLLDFYRLHTDNFQHIKSHHVLETVIN